MTVDSEREILTVRQAAEMLQVSNMMLYRLIRSGHIKAVRLGKFWRISRTELLRVLVQPEMESCRIS